MKKLNNILGDLILIISFVGVVIALIGYYPSIKVTCDCEIAEKYGVVGLTEKTLFTKKPVFMVRAVCEDTIIYENFIHKDIYDSINEGDKYPVIYYKPNTKLIQVGTKIFIGSMFSLIILIGYRLYIKRYKKC